jgi:hypothetical protein
MTSYKKLVHDKLVEVAAAGVFHRVVQSGRSFTVQEDKPLSPKTIYAQESTSSFGPAANNWRTRVLDRDSWEWVLEMEFEAQVVCEAFEESWMAELPRVSSTDDNRRITLLIRDAVYQHPERNQAAKGTIVTYTIVAEIGPR